MFIWVIRGKRSDPDPCFHETDPNPYKNETKLVFFLVQVGSGSVLPQSGSEDLGQYQNETDPRIWICIKMKRIRGSGSV